MATHRRATNKSNTRHRHEAGVQRDSHGGPFDPTGTTDALYGGVTGGQSIGWQDFAGEVIGPGNIQNEAVTPETFDTTPPAAPTGLIFASDIAITSDGTPAVRLTLTLTHATDTDLLGCVVYITSDHTGTGDTLSPDWTYPSEHFLGRESTTLVILGVMGATQYWAKARSRDIQGNESDWTTALTVISAADATPPSVPENLTAISGFRGAIVKWGKVTDSDLSGYEVTYYLDDGSGTAPDESSGVALLTSSNILWINGLVPDERYWFRALSIDRSGNRSAQTADALATASCVPSQIGAADIAANTVTTTHVSTDGLDANVIKTGYLAIDTSDADRADGIRIFKAGSLNPDELVARWDENGLIVYETDDASRYVKIEAGSISLVQGGSTVAAITPDGIDAAAILFGRLPGGHNVIPNSSFEVGTYPTAADTAYAHTTFTAGAAAVNATYSGGVITITTLP